MIDLCKELNVIPVLVTMPMTGAYSDTVQSIDKDFFPTYYKLMNEIAEEKNVMYLDYRYDERLSDDYNLFLDSDHLNNNGAKKS